MDKHSTKSAKSNSQMVILLVSVFGYSLFVLAAFLSADLAGSSGDADTISSEETIVIDDGESTIIVRHHLRVAKGHAEMGRHLSQPFSQKEKAH